MKAFSAGCIENPAGALVFLTLTLGGYNLGPDFFIGEVSEIGRVRQIFNFHLKDTTSLGQNFCHPSPFGFAYF